jgi:hypothetical protein
MRYLIPISLVVAGCSTAPTTIEPNDPFGCYYSNYQICGPQDCIPDNEQCCSQSTGESCLANEVCCPGPNGFVCVPSNGACCQGFGTYCVGKTCGDAGECI